MATFDERQKGFEKKFKKDQELQFKAAARRNKLLGLWAAEQMGLKGEAAEAYAKEVVRSDFDKPGDDDGLNAKRLKRAAEEPDAADSRQRSVRQRVFQCRQDAEGPAEGIKDNHHSQGSNEWRLHVNLYRTSNDSPPPRSNGNRCQESP